MHSFPVILALESGGDVFSAALALRNGEILLRENTNGDFSEIALPTVAALLAEGKMQLRDCDAFAFSAGPGKFSGLRMSCAFCQSFGFALGKPLVAVPSLAALAEEQTPAETVAENTKTITMLPAHRGFVCAAECEMQNGIWRATPPKILNANDKTVPAKTTATVTRPSANAVARLARAMFAKGETVPHNKCAPIYARKKIAQTQKEREKKTRPPRHSCESRNPYNRA